MSVQLSKLNSSYHKEQCVCTPMPCWWWLYPLFSHCKECVLGECGGGGRGRGGRDFILRGHSDLRKKVMMHVCCCCCWFWGSEGWGLGGEKILIGGTQARTHICTHACMQARTYACMHLLTAHTRTHTHSDCRRHLFSQNTFLFISHFLSPIDVKKKKKKKKMFYPFHFSVVWV